MIPSAHSVDEPQREREEGANLARPDHAGRDEEQRDVGDQQRQAFDRLVDLERVVELAGVDDHAQERTGDERRDGEVDPGEAHPRRHPAAGGEGDDPDREDDREDEPVELEVDRRREAELDPVERRQPEHRDEARQHPREQPIRARPVIGRVLVHALVGPRTPRADAQGDQRQESARREREGHDERQERDRRRHARVDRRRLAASRAARIEASPRRRSPTAHPGRARTRAGRRPPCSRDAPPPRATAPARRRR